MQSAEEQTLRFVECLKLLKNSRNHGEVENILGSLNELNYEVDFLTSDIASDLLNVALLHVDPECETSVSDQVKKLIWKLQTSTCNQVELDDESLHNLVHFCLKDASWCQEADRLLLTFHVLGTLVYHSGHRLGETWPEVYSVLRNCLSINESNVNIRHSALKVLQSLTIRRSLDEAYLSDEQIMSIVAMIIEGVTDTFVSSDEVMLCKVLQASMKTLQNIGSARQPIDGEQLGYVLGWLRHLTFLGFPGYASRPIKGFELFPSPVCHQLPQVVVKQEEGPKGRPQMKRRTKRRKKDPKKEPTVTVSNNAESPSEESDVGSPSRSRHLNPPWVKAESSESEISDSDPNAATSSQTSQNRIKTLKAKVRLLAYDTIRVLLLNIDKKERFGYLLNFLPNQSGSLMRSTEHTLVLSMLKDPSAQVRSSAINVLMDFIQYSKQYLILAAEPTHPGSFISISEVMAIILSELHRALHLALLAEQTPMFLVPLLKCLSFLILASPYSRLKSSLLTEMCSDLKILLQNKYEQVRVGALFCLGGVVSYQPHQVEIIKCLGLEGDHWLEKSCLAKLASSSGEVVQVQVEILQTLTLLVTNHFKNCQPVFELYIEAINSTLAHSYPSVRIHALKLTAQIAKQISEFASSSSSLPEKEGKEFGQLGNRLWQECLFSGLIQCCLQSPSSDESKDHDSKEQQVLQREAINCLSNIGQEMWDQLPERNQRFSICVLLAQARHAGDDTATAAMRCLAIMCTCESMAQDTIFLQDMGDLCVEVLNRTSGKASCLPLKVKASWALSNVCDALLSLKNTDLERSQSEIGLEFLKGLLQTSVFIWDGKDSIRINSVRSMGLLLALGSARILNALGNLAKEAVELLLKSASYSGDKFCKAKWNACYALGWILKNNDTRNQLDVQLVLRTLTQNLKTCANLKVQIACVSAIDQLAESEGVEDTILLGMVNSLVDKTVDVSTISVDYKELKHFQSVKEQLCVTLMHFLEVLRQELWPKIGDVFKRNRDALEALFKQSLGRGDIRRKLELLLESSNWRGQMLRECLPSLPLYLQQSVELYAFEM